MKKVFYPTVSRISKKKIEQKNQQEVKLTP